MGIEMEEIELGDVISNRLGTNNEEYIVVGFQNGVSLFGDNSVCQCIRFDNAGNVMFSVHDPAMSKLVRKKHTQTLDLVKKVQAMKDSGYNPWM